MGRTQFIIEDFSDIRPSTTTNITPIDRAHLFFTFSSDKGPETFQKNLDLNAALALYVRNRKTVFKRHGQPLLGALECARSGGTLQAKRIVAHDSYLANFGIAVRVRKEKTFKTTLDADGNTLFYYYLATDTTQETLDASLAEMVDDGTGVFVPHKVEIQRAVLTFEVFQVTGPDDNVDAFATAFESQIQALAPSSTVYPTNGEEGLYPLFLFTDNGRGESFKRIFIDADTGQNRPVDYVKYLLRVVENDTVLETMAFTVNQDVIENMRNISLVNAVRRYSRQIRARQYEEAFEAMVENIATITGIDATEIQNADLFRGVDLNGNVYDKIAVDFSSGVDFSSVGTGVQLMGGSNGSFGNFPLNSNEYSQRMAEVFSQDEIYDLDDYRIDAILDQNYPTIVKRAIEELVEFRQDCSYLRDMGFGLVTVDQILQKNRENLKSKFCATYHNSWNIEDPFTRKEIAVTIGYSLISRFCRHFLGGIGRPFAGIPFGITWNENEVIPGTVNFIPKLTPSADQIQLLKDARINYVVSYNGLLSMEAEFTSQERYTQLSFLNNVLNLQSVIRAVRQFCPTNRYKFITTNDLSTYQKDVNRILEKFASTYQTLKLVYAKDENYENNKIYYAYIYVRFYNFIADELFRIAVLSTRGSGYEDTVAFNTGTGTEY